VRLPFGSLHGLLRGHVEKGISVFSRFMDSLVHESSDPVVIVAGDELGESAGVEFASGRLEPRREPLGVLEDIIGDRDGSFHTKSITGDSPLGKASGTRLYLTLDNSAWALDEKHDSKRLRGGKSNAGKGFWSRRTSPIVWPLEYTSSIGPSLARI